MNTGEQGRAGAGPGEAPGNGTQPRRPKSPGRVAGALRTNIMRRALRAEGRDWGDTGGHPIEHGTRALEVRHQRGQDPPGRVGVALHQIEADVLSDLGEPPSTLERGHVRHVAFLDVLLNVARARFLAPNGEAKRMSKKDWAEATGVLCRLGDSRRSYVSDLGLKRRQKEATEVIVKDYSTPAAGMENEATRGSENSPPSIPRDSTSSAPPSPEIPSEP